MMIREVASLPAANPNEVPPVTHFLNTVCVCMLFYASVTRGGVGIARVLERLVRRPT